MAEGRGSSEVSHLGIENITPVQESSPHDHKTAPGFVSNTSPRRQALRLINNTTARRNIFSLRSKRDGEIERIILERRQDFIKYINIDALKPCLKDQKLLTRSEEKGLTAEKLILYILPKKSFTAFESFYEALKNECDHKGHKELVEIIEQELN